MAIEALRDPTLLRQACLVGGNWQAAASGLSLIHILISRSYGARLDLPFQFD